MCLSIIELMSSESEICDNRTPTAVPSNPIYTNAVNCQWGTCMQQFFCITDLVRHVEKTHIPKAIMKEYVCLWRNCLWKRKRFKDQCRLVKHLQIIAGEESNKCSVSPPTIITGTCSICNIYGNTSVSTIRDNINF